MDGESNVRDQIRHYERYARRFDHSVWSLGNRDNRNHLVKVRAIARALDAANAGGILEVGTGTGLHARWLLENTPASYTGVDASEPMLALAAERLGSFDGRFALGIADAHRLPFPDGAFDATFCSGTLHHLNAPGRGVAEIVRVTRPGGRVAIMEPNWKFPSTLLVGASTPAERNVFKISPAHLTAWGRAAGLTGLRLERLLYSPPAPRSWGKLWDAVDRGAGRVPGLRRLSIMLLLSGRAPG
jgi:ubiquinone/menaquinone biosynthesis C-methylase UbiE